MGFYWQKEIEKNCGRDKLRKKMRGKVCGGKKCEEKNCEKKNREKK